MVNSEIFDSNLKSYHNEDTNIKRANFGKKITHFMDKLDNNKLNLNPTNS